MCMRLIALAVALLSAAACTPETTGGPPPTGRETAVAAAPANGIVPAGRWRAVLIAGDNNSPAFDNGVQSLREKLMAHGVRDIAVYSSAARRAGSAELASVANVAAALRAGGGDACFVFVTSHGERTGFVLKTDRRLFDPGSLDRVLSVGCGSVPTVVVVSTSAVAASSGCTAPSAASVLLLLLLLL